MYILLENEGYGCEDFYVGKTYTVQGECYPYTTNNKTDAKKYTSEGRARNALDKLNLKTGRSFIVEKLD